MIGYIAIAFGNIVSNSTDQDALHLAGEFIEDR